MTNTSLTSTPASSSLHSETGPERPLPAPSQAPCSARPLAASSATPMAHRSTAWPMGLGWAALPQARRALRQATKTNKASSRTASQAEAIAWWGGRVMRKFIIVGILGAVLTTPAAAEEAGDICASLAELAHTYAEAKYAGVPLGKIMEIASQDPNPALA